MFPKAREYIIFCPRPKDNSITAIEKKPEMFTCKKQGSELWWFYSSKNYPSING